MTNTSLESFVKNFDKAHAIQDILKRGKDPRKSILEKAKKELKNFAFGEYSSYVSQKLEPFASWTKVNDADSLADDQEGMLVNFSSEISRKNAANILSEKSEEIAGAISNKGLESIVGAQDQNGKSIFGDYVEKADKKIYSAYLQMIGIENMAKAYDAGDRSEEVKKIAGSAVRDGLVKTTMDSLKAAGYDSDVQELGAKFALDTLKHLDKAKEDVYAKAGFAEIVKNAKEQYASTVVNGRDIYAVMKAAIVKGAKAKSTEEFGNVAEAVYGASKQAA